jgi:HSP20 family protein
MQLDRREDTNGGYGALSRQIHRLLGDFFEPGSEFGMGLSDAGSPPIDIAETPEAFIVKAEVPGFDPGAIEISFADGLLTIQGARREEKEEKGKTWHRVESRRGSFARAVRLPVEVVADKVEAEIKDGVLTVKAPKARPAPSKRIEVKAR